MELDLRRHFRAMGYQAELDGADLLSPDGRDAYEIKLIGRGTRDIRDAALRLATFLARNPKVDRGYVLAALIRISAERVRAEWQLIKRAIRPELGSRMHLLALVEGAEVAEPEQLPSTPVTDHFLKLGRSAPLSSRPALSQEEGLPIGSPPAMRWKFHEIEKVLLNRWLLNKGPIPIGKLGGQVGCSYPTTMRGIRELTAKELVERGRGRSVALARYPRDRWVELLRSQRLIYPPQAFVDPTAGPGAADEILRRLSRLKPKGAAIGGVVAARRWDPSFDLNGTPRVDVLLHTPVERALDGHGRVRDASEFVRRLDPALKRKSPKVSGATVLVIHHTYRHESLFVDDASSPIPRADPVEVLCQLNEMGLTAQAGQLLRLLQQDQKT